MVRVAAIRSTKLPFVADVAGVAVRHQSRTFERARDERLRHSRMQGFVPCHGQGAALNAIPHCERIATLRVRTSKV